MELDNVALIIVAGLVSSFHNVRVKVILLGIFRLGLLVAPILNAVVFAVIALLGDVVFTIQQVQHPLIALNLMGSFASPKNGVSVQTLEIVTS